MATLLWARWDTRGDGTSALTLFRRKAVETPRGQMLEDIPVLVVEDVKGKVKEAPEAVELELEVGRESDGTIVVTAMATATNRKPKDPKIKLTSFDDPESKEAKERKERADRGMGRFRGKEEGSKPVSKSASPPIPPEQKVGGRTVARGRRRGQKGNTNVNRGGARRGGARGKGKKT
jgi:hypothetical protein